MGKMSDVERYAEAIGKDPRTVRRQCQAGKIQAWRDDKGQWRIEPRLLQVAEMRKDLCDHFGPLTARNKRMFEATLFAHGIKTYKDEDRLRKYHAELLRSKPGSRSRKKWRFLYLKDQYHHDKNAHLVVDNPVAWIEQQSQQLGYVPKIRKLKKMMKLAHLKEAERHAWIRFRIDQKMQELGRVPTIKELKRMTHVCVAELYRAVQGKLIKKLKRRFLDDPTAPGERQDDKPWLSAAKMKPKEKLNRVHDRD
jgi:hypothetical protein